MTKEEKEFKVAKGTTAQVFDKMLKTSSPLGDEFICLSSYAVGQTIGDQIIPTSDQLKGYKKAQLGRLSDSLARNISTKSFSSNTCCHIKVTVPACELDAVVLIFVAVTIDPLMAI